MTAADGERVTAIDRLRGLVMVLMAVDHADAAYDRGHLQTDGVALPQLPLTAPEFLTRWATHLCAPTFVFLAGTAIALSAARRGGGGRDFDRNLLARGAVLVLLEVTLVSYYWRFVDSDLGVTLQVLFAIGAAMACMVFLRRLRPPVQVALGVALIAVCEPLFRATLPASGAGSPPLPVALLAGVGFYPAWPPDLLVLYPLLPWLGMMLLGSALGHVLSRDRAAAGRVLLWWAAGALALFLVLRGANGFGNMLLYRRDGSLLEWLHVSKYPPSLAFVALELGLMALLLGPALWRRPGRSAAGGRWEPLLVFGQVPLFFYLIHLPVIGLWEGLGLVTRGGLRETWIATVLTVAATYPLCLLYRRYKQVHRHRWTRYL